MFQKIFLSLLILFFPMLTLAHGGHGNGVLSGFTHPIFGLDHAVAILGTGILGFLLNASRWYLFLLGFLIPMIIAGIFGIDHEATFFIEKVIAFSVLCIGSIIAFNLKINHTIILVLMGTFGAFHGYAHGAEMDEVNTALKYISGYAAGTLLVGLVGMLLAKTISSQNKKENYVHILGGSILGAGIVMLLS